MTAASALARGDVVLVSFPFTDLSSARVRPALVVGRVAGDDLILAFITSQTTGSDPRSTCLLRSGDAKFAQTGLKVDSLVRLDKPDTLHRRLVLRRLGQISPNTTELVNSALRFVLALE